MNANLYTARELGAMFGKTEAGIRHQVKGLEPDGRGERNAALYAIDRYAKYVFQTKGAEVRDLNVERARLAAAQADKQEMDNGVRRGELATLEWYRDELTNYTRAVASAWDALPGGLKRLLPHLTHIDNARIERHFAEERDRLADRLASGSSEGEGSGGDGSAVAADSSTASS